MCIVQLESDSEEPTLETVRTNMRFVENIGPLVAPLCDNLDTLKGLRDNITTSEESGVQLEIEAGIARVRVANAIWESKGFSIEHLLDRLLGSLES